MGQVSRHAAPSAPTNVEVLLYFCICDAIVGRSKLLLKQTASLQLLEPWAVSLWPPVREALQPPNEGVSKVFAA